jgi:taurine---2-oxoglutarate transaminase
VKPDKADGPGLAEAPLGERLGRRAFYTWSAQREVAPLEIVGGQGATFETADGARWLDLGSMVWNANLGHGHPAMIKAIVRAAERGLLTLPSGVFPDKVTAAERLLEVAPSGLSTGKVFFCLSGAEANENAVKMARLYTGRRKIIYRTRSYHGATLGMLSLSGDPRRRPFDPGIEGGIAWNDPYSAAPHPADLEALLREAGPDTVAAVMLEGVVGANGVYVPPAGYFKRVRAICDRFGVLLIADEVLSGFGRTGRWFAVDHDGVSPDLLTCAKGLSGGYAPAGAVVASAAVAAHFDNNVLSCGLTAYAHPLTCAAIVAAIDAYREGDLREGNLIVRAARTGIWLQAELQRLVATRPFVRALRGIGLLWALELGEPASTEAASPARMRRLRAAIERRRLHLHKRDHMIFLAPPLVATEAELAAGLAALAEALDDSFATETS